MGKYRSVFDIIGPVMVGPSSSHTAGAVRIGKIARNIYGRQPDKVKITFYGSFAHTYRGHGTDVAIISGLLNFDTFDERIPEAFSYAEEAGMDVEIKTSDEKTRYPNTAKIELTGQNDKLLMTGVSIGGGAIMIADINGFRCHIAGDTPALLVMHKDIYGTIARIMMRIADYKINVSHLEDSRHAKGEVALMIIETDEPISRDLQNELRELPNVERVIEVRL